MRIRVDAPGFDLTAGTRRFLESRLRSRLRPFETRIDSVVVHFEASRCSSGSAHITCGIIVNLQPHGQVSSRGQDTQLPAALEHAATRLAAQVAREFSHRQPTPEFRAVVVADPRDERALASGVNDESITDDARQNVERREHHVRRVPRGELWKPLVLETNPALDLVPL